ncbi:MAG: hypothetical protein QGI43_08645, partial [Gemmatimonadota bacterium]|nr:hypothetical protein [Gemmatimonadota bacterium]
MSQSSTALFNPRRFQHSISAIKPPSLLLFVVLIPLLLGMAVDDANAQSVSLSTNGVYLGDSVTASWSGFGGNVNVEVWKGGSF